MPQDPSSLSYHNFVGEAEANEPLSKLPLGQDGDGIAKPFQITDNLLDQIAGGIKRQPYSYDVSDPYTLADRYIHGLGHSGYVGADSEEFNAVRQSIPVKWVNGVAKFAGNTVSTAVAGTVGLLNGFGAMLSSPFTEGHFDFSKFYDNFTTNKMEDLNEYMERVFPHYETKKFREAAWYSPDAWATANYWTNGFLKNLGFAAGALVTGELAGFALAKVPQITEWALAARKALSSGKFAADYKLMEGALGVLGDVDDIRRASAIREIALKPGAYAGELGVSAERLADAANQINKFKTAFQKQFISTMGAVGESSMEAIQGKHTIREELIEDYKQKHNGDMPDPTTMEEIEAKASEGANWRWGLNLATLTISNNIQFPRLLSNSVKNQMGAFTHEVNDIAAINAEGEIAGKIVKPGSKETYADAAAQRALKRSRAMKIINPVYQFMKNPITLSESVEEGLQYAYEKGTESYEQMKFDGRATNLYHELIYTGIGKTFTDREGIESMLFGGLTGKLMDATLGRKERARKNQNTNALLDILNSDKYTVAGTLKGDAVYENALRNSSSPYMDAVREASIRGQAINQENNVAVAKGDIERQRDLDKDFIFNMALPNIKYGRTDVFKEELMGYHSSKMPFEEAKKLLGLTDEMTSEDLDKAITRRTAEVNKIAKLHEFVNGSFNIIDRKTGKPKYDPATIDTMLYSLFKIDSQDERYNKLVDEITTATGADFSPLTDYYKRRKEGTAGEERENFKDLDTVRGEITGQITEAMKKAVRENPTLERDKNGISIFDKLRDLESIQNAREGYVKSYHALRERTLDKPEVTLGHITDTKTLEDYEDIAQYPILMGELQKSTLARRLAAKLSVELEALDDEDIEKVVQQLEEIEKMVTTENAFMSQDDIKYFREVVAAIGEKVYQKAKDAAAADFTSIPGLDELPYDKAVPFLKGAIEQAKEDEMAAEADRAEGAEPLPPMYSPEQVKYMESILTAYDAQTGLLAALERTEKVLQQLDQPEPVTPLISDIKRQIADTFMAKYPAIEQAIVNPDYSEVEEVQAMLDILEGMKKWYEPRKELLATKAFNEHKDAQGNIVKKPFIELLDERITKAKEWLAEARKRRGDILKDDNMYYRTRVENYWNMLGVKLSVAVQQPPPEPDEETKKKITTLEDEKKTAVDAAATDEEKLKIAADYDSQIEALKPKAPEPSATKEHVGNKVLYDLVVSMVGEETVLHALAAFQQEYDKYRATERGEAIDFEKHVLGIVQMIWNAPDSAYKTLYRTALQEIIRSPVDLMNMKEHDFSAYVGSTPYTDITGNYINYEERVLQFLFDSKGAAYSEYLRHRDISRFYWDLRKDIKEGTLDYTRLDRDAAFVEPIVRLMVTGRAAHNMAIMLDSKKSLTDVYDAFKQGITDQQTNNRPVPSDKQLLSVLDMLLFAYNSKTSFSTPYDAMIYLDGRIGAGKTVMTGMLLKILNRLEGSDIAKSTILAGDTALVGQNLEETIGIDQTQGKGTSITNVIDFLNGGPSIDALVPADIRFIVIDEAARAPKEIEALAKALAAYNSAKGTQIRVFLMGDVQQVTGEVAKGTRINAIKGIHTATPLSTSFRGKVSSINSMQSTFLNAESKDLRNTKLTFTANVERPWEPTSVAAYGGLLVGVSGSLPGISRQQRLDHAVQVLRNRKGIQADGKPLDKAIIVNRGTEKDWADRLEKAEAGLSKEFRIVSYFDAQGKTFDEVYLDLDIDPADPLIKNLKFLNTAMYTAGRARNFIYLINNAVETKQDPDLMTRFRTNTKALEDNSTIQYNKVSHIAAHLDKIKKSTIPAEKKAETKEEKKDTGTTETKKGTEEEKERKEEAQKEAEENPEGGDTNTPPEGSPEDGAFNDEGFTPFPQGTNDILELPPPPQTKEDDFAPKIIEGNFFVSNGQLGFNLSYPTGGALHWYNNVSVTHPDGTTTYRIPEVGQAIRVVPMPLDRAKDKSKYGVFRETGHSNVHQLMGVLSEAEVQQLIQKVPGFADYHNTVIAANQQDGVNERGGMFAMIQENKQDVAPEAEMNSFYGFNESLSSLPSFMQGKMVERTELEYTYDPSIESPLINLNAEHQGLDWLKEGDQGTGTEPGLLRIWYNDMFKVDEKGKPGVAKAPSWAQFKNIARVRIVTINRAEMKKLTSRTKGDISPYTKLNVPVELGATYLRIENIPDNTNRPAWIKPQYIRLEGAVLNHAMQLHRKLYIDPMQKFVETADELSSKLNDFILNEMKEDPVAFEKLWKNNAYTMKAVDTATGQNRDMVFKRDNATGFDISSNIFNHIAKLLINMDWEDTTKVAPAVRNARRKALGDNRTHNDPKVDAHEAFMNRLFNTLRDKKMDKAMSEVARRLRTVQKKQEELYVKNDKTGEKEVVRFTYADGTPATKLDLKGNRNDTGEHASTRLAQVALMNLAQANGDITDPVTGKKISIVRFTKRTEKDKETKKSETRDVREAYDLMESDFSFVSLYDEEGKPHRDLEIVNTAYNAQLSVTPERIMHINVWQLKQKLDFLVRGEYFNNLRKTDASALAYKGRGFDALYADVLEEKKNNATNTPATALFEELMLHTYRTYDMTRMDMQQLRNVFFEGFNEDGEHKTQLRVNIPIWLSKAERGVGQLPRWEDPADPSSNNPLAQASPHQRIGEMLSTNFTGVRATNIGIVLNTPYNEEESLPTEKEQAPAETYEEHTLEAGTIVPDNYRAPVEGDTIVSPEGTVYTVRGYSDKGNVLYSRPDLSKKSGIYNGSWSPKKIQENFAAGWKYTESKEEPAVIVPVVEEKPSGEEAIEDTKPTQGLDKLNEDTKAATAEEVKDMYDDPTRPPRRKRPPATFTGDTKGMQLTEKEAHAYLKKMVPGISDDMIEFLDRSGMLKKYGTDVLGLVQDGAVAFLRGDNTIYSNVVKHEAFHAIFRYFTNPEQRARILNAAIHYYGLEDTNPEHVEEALAREFGNRDDNRPSIIQRFFNWLARLFGFVTRNEAEIKNYFEKIERGAFAEPAKEPLLGTAHFTKFEEYYQSDYNLFRNVLGTFAVDYQRMAMRGVGRKIGDRRVLMPLGKDEVAERLHEHYKGVYKSLMAAKSYKNLSEDLQDNLNILSDKDLKNKQRIYLRLASYPIYHDLLTSSYPDKFRTSKEVAELKDIEGNTTIDYLPTSSDDELDSRLLENANLSAIIKSDNDIDPRSTLSDRVHLYLQTIMANDPREPGAVMPVSKEFSLFTLYHSINNLPLELQINARQTILDELKEVFRDRTLIRTKEHSTEAQAAVKALNEIKNKYAHARKPADRHALIEQADKELETLWYYFDDLAHEEQNPNVQFSIEGACSDIFTIRSTLNNKARLDAMDSNTNDRIVRDNLGYVEEILRMTTRTEPVSHNSWSAALYDALRRLIIDTYTPRYVIPGWAPVSYRADRMFINDDTFYYKGHKIRRDGRSNEDYFGAIVSFAAMRSRKMGKMDLDDQRMIMEDVIAMWRHRQSYNILADLMSVANNTYLTKPHRLKIEEKDFNYKINIQNILHNDVTEDQASRIISAIDEKIIVKKGDKLVFSTSALKATRNAVKAGGSPRDILTTFYQELLGESDLKYNEVAEESAMEGLRLVVSTLEDTLSSTHTSPEDFDTEEGIFGNNKGALTALATPLVNKELGNSLTTYWKGDGKQASGIRQQSHADYIVAVINRYQRVARNAEQRKKQKPIIDTMAPFLDSIVHMDNGLDISFLGMNAINPFTFLPNGHIEIGNHRLFDSHLSVSWNHSQWNTSYRDESKKDILTRLFVGNYMSSIAQDHLFSKRRSESVTGGEKVFTIQPFYVMSDKGRSQGVDMELVPTDASQNIGQIIFQMLHRPLKEYTRTITDPVTGKEIGKERPYDNDNYNPYSSPFQSLSSPQVKALRDRFGRDIHRAVKDNKLPQLFDTFMKDAEVQSAVKEIRREFEQEAKIGVDFIMKNMIRNSDYEMDNGTPMRRLRKDTGFRIPSQELLTKVYNRLYRERLITDEDIKKYGGDKIKADKATGVTLVGYNGHLRNVQVSPEHLMPLMVNFATNHFVRGYFLAQMTMDDNGVYKSQADIIKRMGIAQGGGKSYFNIANVLRAIATEGKGRDDVKFLVVDDIIRYRNLSKTITHDNYDPSKYNAEEADDISKERAWEIVNTLSGMSQLTKPQFDNFNKAFSILREAKEDVTHLVSEYKKLNLNTNTVNDGAGFITQRGHDRFALVGGPGLNTQDLMKPLVMGRDKYGIARPAKFAVETLTDRVVAQFPALFELRFQADFGYLNRADTIADYQKAYKLEKERIEKVKNSKDATRPDLLNPNDEAELNRIYNSSQNRPSHLVVPESAVKFNCPRVRGTYNYVTDTYDKVDHLASSFTVGMRDFRIQQDPVSDPEAQTVAMSTQLLYMANANSKNYAEMQALFDHYTEVQRIGFDEVDEDNHIELAPEGEGASPELMARNLNSFIGIMIDRYENNPAKTIILELLKKSKAGGNFPAASEDVYMQALGGLQKATADHRFEGMKLVQLTPGLRARTAIPAKEDTAFKETGFDEPLYDSETMTAEVYAPTRMLRHMQKAFPDKTEEELINLIPVTYGFRVPATGLNSAIRIKVKGFYPSEINAFVGPADMHLIMGSDFDVDAMFIVLPRWAKSDLNKGNSKLMMEGIDKLYGGKYNNMPVGFSINTVEKEGKTISEMVPIAGFKEKVKQLYDTAPDTATKKAYRDIYRAFLDNSMLYQYNNILANPDNRMDVMHPINFDIAKSLTNPDSLFNLRAFALSENSTIDPAFKKDYNEALENGKLYFDSKVSKDMLRRRDRILNKNYNVNTPSGYMKIQADTMGGAGLVGIEVKATQTIAYNMFAINPNDVMRVRHDSNTPDKSTNLGIDYDGELRVQIGRRKEDGTYEITLGEKGRSVFSAMQWIVNGTLDAVKEGIPQIMNLTQATANSWTAGLILNMDEARVQSFMNLPCIKEISDYKKIKENIIYTIQRELFMLQDIKKLAPEEFDGQEVERIYAGYDKMYKEKKKNFETKVRDAAGKVKLTHEQTKKYEVYETLDEARKAIKDDAEFEAFLNYQLAALEMFKKLNEIGDAFYTTQRITNLVNNTPIMYHEFQRYLKDVYGIYKVEKKAIGVRNPIDNSGTPQRIYSNDKKLKKGKDGLPEVKDGFAIQGINLFRLQHLRQAFDNYTHFYKGAKSTFLKHHPDIEGMALVAMSQFKLSKMGKNEYESLKMIKDDLMAYFTGMVEYRNADGERTPLNGSIMNSKNELQTPFEHRGRMYYGPQAFMQQFVREVNDIQYKPEYAHISFLQRLVIKPGARGLWRMKIKSVSGITQAEIADLQNSFRTIDQPLRDEFMKKHPEVKEYWYSPLQIKFLKYALLDHGLTFGASRYSQLLPVDMQIQLQESLFHLMTPFMSKAPLKTDIKQEKDEETGKMEDVSVEENPLVDKTFQDVGLKIRLNHSEGMAQLSYQDNTEYAKSTDPGMQVIAELAELQEVNEKITHNLKREGDIYYNYKLFSMNNTQELEERYPLFVKNRSLFRKGEFDVYIRVSEQRVNKNYTAYYRRVSSVEDSKSLLGNIESMLLGYNIKEMFAARRPAFTVENLSPEGHLRVDVDMPVTGRQQVLITEPGDVTLERAKVYRIVKKLGPANPQAARKEIDQITKEMVALYNNRKIDVYKKADQLRGMRNKRDTLYATYEIEDISKGTIGIRAVKMADGKMSEEVQKQAAEVESILRNDATRLKISVLLSREEEETARRLKDQGLIKKC